MSTRSQKGAEKRRHEIRATHRTPRRLLGWSRGLPVPVVRRGAELQHLFEHRIGAGGDKKGDEEGERRTETRHWSEDRNSPWLGPKHRSDTRRPCVGPDTGLLTGCGPC